MAIRWSLLGHGRFQLVVVLVNTATICISLLGPAVSFFKYRRMQHARYRAQIASRRLPDGTVVTVVPESRPPYLVIAMAVPVLLVIFAVYSVIAAYRRLTWHGGISIRSARRLRNCLLRDRRWRWYHRGYVPWMTINAILYQFDCQRKNRTCNAVTGKRGIEAFIAVRESVTTDAALRQLGKLWQEFAIRTPEEFEKRDRRYFMERSGVLLTESAKVLVSNALLMREDDYIKLFHVFRRLMNRLLKRMLAVGGLQSEILLYFVGSEKECREKFVTFRADMLNRARKYADNMMMFSSTYCSPKAAHAWHDVAKSVVLLQDLELNDMNEPRIRDETAELFRRMDRAFAFAFLKYQELDDRGRVEAEGEQVLLGSPVPQAKLAPPVKKDAPQPTRAVASKLPIFKGKEKVGRFRISDSKNGLYIEDTEHRRGHQKRVYDKIKAPTVKQYFNIIFAKFNEGYDEFVCPLDNWKWRSSCNKGSANEFINEEMETWTEVHPDASHEEKHDHRGWYRIIPDGQSLKDEG